MKKAEPKYLTNAREFLANFDKYLVNPHSRVDVNFACTRLAKNDGIVVGISSGMSRTCIIYKDFVVKFDTGNSYYGHNYSEFIGYKNAVREGYSHLFAPMHRIKVGHRYYYVMMRIAYLAYDTEENYSVDWTEANEGEQWVYDHFNDLHDENWGFDYDDEPRLIDYAYNDFFIPSARSPKRFARKRRR